MVVHIYVCPKCGREFDGDGECPYCHTQLHLVDVDVVDNTL